MFRPDTSYRVYHVKEWEGDSWDPKNYGKDFDFSRTFFDQFDELMKSVPLPHLAVIESTLENAEYVNGANSVKNAYLSDNIVNAEDVYYCEDIYDSKDIFDSLSLTGCERCYGCVNSAGLYDSRYMYECQSCSDSAYCSFCKGCRDCIGCIGLTNKRHCIFNVQHSPQEYERMRSQLTPEEIRLETGRLSRSTPYRCTKIIGSHDVSGDNIIRSSDIRDSYDIYDCENIAHSVFLVGDCRDCSDITFW